MFNNREALNHGVHEDFNILLIRKLKKFIKISRIYEGNISCKATFSGYGTNKELFYLNI